LFIIQSEIHVTLLFNGVGPGLRVHSRPRQRGYSAWMPALLASSFQRLISLTRKSCDSAGVSPTASRPSPLSQEVISGDFRMATNSLFRRSIVAAGVLAGT